MNDPEFYIGYLPKAPQGLARQIRRTVIALAAAAIVIGLALVLGQAPFPAATFEFGQYRDFNGVYIGDPYPSLLDRHGARHLLVAPGKHGFAPPAGFDGMRVSLRGSRIYRDGNQMIEVIPDSLAVQQGGMPECAPAWTDLGAVSLTGEIVDTKCFFGVMNPGQGKVHRACAVRCISGGIPAGFLARDRAGHGVVLLLNGSDGRRLNREVLDIVGVPVRIDGRLAKAADTYVLRTEPSRIRRLGEEER